MKSRLIVNPVAGRDSAPDFLQTLNQRLRDRFGAMDIVLTIGPGDATAAAAEAASAGYEQIFAAGGDGTLNEVINGVAGVGALDRVTFGIVPLGTGNDFATALGISVEIDEALETLTGGRQIRADLGALGPQHFANVSAGGFIAEVSEAVDPTLKSMAGKLAYLIGGAQVLFDYTPTEMKIEFEGAEGSGQRELTMQMFAVCNSRMIGGGRLIAPEAWIDDGLLDVCVVEAMPTAEFIGLLRSVAVGEHLSDPRVSYFQVKTATLEFARSVKVNTDGEVLDATRCEYSVLRGATQFIAGANAFAVKALSVAAE